MQGNGARMEGGKRIILHFTANIRSKGILKNIPINLKIMGLGFNKTPLVAISPNMVNGSISDINFHRCYSKKPLHDLIKISMWCVTEKMKMISHENKGMNGQGMFFHFNFKLFHHDHPDFLQGNGEKFLIITS